MDYPWTSNGLSRVIDSRKRRVIEPSSDLSYAEQVEVARLIAAIPKLLTALSMFVSYGCPMCNGDCVAANPPVLNCPMKLANAAIQCATED